MAGVVVRRFPGPALARESRGWTREVEARIVELEKSAARQGSADLNTNKAQNSSIDLVSKNIVDLEQRVQEAVSAITIFPTQVNAGTFAAGVIVPSANVSGTLSNALVTTSAIQADGGINSIDVYTRLVTGTGSFRTTSANSLGQLGQTVSSRDYKQDIHDAKLDISREDLRRLRLVLFRYIASIPFDQEQQPWLLGLIAEEVHKIKSLRFLVFYNEQGKPEALVDFALPFLGLLLAQYDADDIDTINDRLDRAGL